MRKAHLRALMIGATCLTLDACAQYHQEEFSRNPPSLHVAQTALDNGAPAIALSVANANLAVNPTDSAAIVYRGDAYAAMGRNDDAKIEYGRALALDPNSPGAALGLARMSLPQDPATAARLLSPLVVRDAASASVYNDLGVARDLLGRHVDAQADYRQALALDPRMTAALDNLARSIAITSHH